MIVCGQLMTLCGQKYNKFLIKCYKKVNKMWIIFSKIPKKFTKSDDPIAPNSQKSAVRALSYYLRSTPPIGKIEPRGKRLCGYSQQKYARRRFIYKICSHEEGILIFSLSFHEDTYNGLLFSFKQC